MLVVNVCVITGGVTGWESETARNYLDGVFFERGVACNIMYANDIDEFKERENTAFTLLLFPFNDLGGATPMLSMISNCESVIESTAVYTENGVSDTSVWSKEYSTNIVICDGLCALFRLHLEVGRNMSHSEQ